MSISYFKKEPVSVKPWGENILGAANEGPHCTQFDRFSQGVLGVEDCLRLNIKHLHTRSKLVLQILDIFIFCLIHSSNSLD